MPGAQLAMLPVPSCQRPANQGVAHTHLHPLLRTCGWLCAAQKEGAGACVSIPFINRLEGVRPAHMGPCMVKHRHPCAGTLHYAPLADGADAACRPQQFRTHCRARLLRQGVYRVGSSLQLRPD